MCNEVDDEPLYNEETNSHLPILSVDDFLQPIVGLSLELSPAHMVASAMSSNQLRHAQPDPHMAAHIENPLIEHSDQTFNTKACLNNGTMTAAKQPEMMRIQMRPYQLQALSWMIQREREPGNFCLL